MHITRFFVGLLTTNISTPYSIVETRWIAKLVIAPYKLVTEILGRFSEMSLESLVQTHTPALVFEKASF
ncbi:hypothetical protein [Nostoc sp. FACHB-133]|uniref:hypothetical protein n=1 Tax=Nostoc sp. FACHB-133 TaxID=2692835 RepID=UPI001689F9E5|nr:hypothetical protein [Nostoc sp. FACHB-133]